MAREKVWFANLDGLRFIAALMVYLQHGFAHWSKEDHISNDFLLRLAETASSGGLGVSIFFVLSGFLITYLLLEEQKTTGTIDVKKFYIRRILRIWPLYYLVVFFGLVVYPMMKNFAGVDTVIQSNPVLYWIFLSNFDELNILHHDLVRLPQALSITWSVAIEEQFYLIWPLLFLFSPPSKYKYIFPVIILCSIFFRLVNADDDPVLYFHTVSVLVDLGAGGMAAYLALTYPPLIRFFRNLNLPVSLALYIAGFAGLLYWDVWDGYYSHALARVFFAVYFVFIIMHQNYAPDSFLKMSHFPRISAMGKYTYGLYLLHPVAILVIDLFLRIRNVERGSNMELLYGSAGLVLSLLLSIASYHFFETRFLKLKKRFSVIRSGA